jgi:acetyltransferase-like isoleucine patch superfamily enzyme
MIQGKFNVIGDNIKMGKMVILSSFIEIRDGCEIGDYTVIGSHVVMAAGTKIGSDCHIHGGAFFADDTKLNGEHIPPIIRNKVKFGTNVKVMGGVEIGENAIIGANSTVFSDVPAYEVWGGTPAKKIRDLEGGEIIL